MWYLTDRAGSILFRSQDDHNIYAPHVAYTPAGAPNIINLTFELPFIIVWTGDPRRRRGPPAGAVGGGYLTPPAAAPLSPSPPCIRIRSCPRQPSSRRPARPGEFKFASRIDPATPCR
ncbi:hypothetical protein EVAR_6071_1 [Eumeta japonica]|uniref:Uncharacterized protein n=1 Tax=Eumeta variegata TaxID=151549 RepID=A0A4C1TF16_EUMVA|nr:hypothetical protein EVAR_6071_1 [Eumeta japonica]